MVDEIGVILKHVCEIKDLNNIIIDYLTIGERLYLENKKCTQSDLLDVVKEYISAKLYDAAYDIVAFNGIDEESKSALNRFVMQEYDKDHILWLHNVGLLENQEYHEIIQNPIEKMQISSYVPYLWILFTSGNYSYDSRESHDSRDSNNLHESQKNDIFKYVDESTIILAGKYGHFNIVKLLIDNCAINIQKMVYMYYRNDEDNLKFDWNILKYLIDNGMVMNTNILIWIAKYGNIRMFHYLETKGNQIDFSNDSGYSIAFAASRNDFNMVKYILEHNPRIDGDFIDWPANKNLFEMVKYVVEETHYGRTKIKHHLIKNQTIRTRNNEMIMYLLNKREERLPQDEIISLIKTAIETNNLELLQYLCQKQDDKHLTIKLSYTEYKYCNKRVLDFVGSNFILRDHICCDLIPAIHDDNNDVAQFLLEKMGLDEKSVMLVFKNVIKRGNLKIFNTIVQKYSGIVEEKISCEMIEDAFEAGDPTIINWITKQSHVIDCSNCFQQLIKYGQADLFSIILRERKRKSVYTNLSESTKYAKIYKRPKILKMIENFAKDIPKNYFGSKPRVKIPICKTPYQSYSCLCEERSKRS